MKYSGAMCSALPLLGASKGVFRIIPAGSFKASDGRPVGGSWFLSESRGAAMVAAANERQSDYVIDYEHQSIESARNGKPAPAAGWFRKLEWRVNGLYVIDARWTAEARQMIDAQQYRFISPVFQFDPRTFEVLRLQNVSLTNDPALHGLTDLAMLKNGFEPSTSRLFEELTEKDRAVLCANFGDDIFDIAEAALREEAELEQESITSKDRETLNAAFRHYGLTF